jgi:hypothetical protein
LVKTDEFGNMQWNQTYEEGGGSIIQTFDGGYAFAGSYPNGDTFLDAFLIKTDVNGVVEFHHNHTLVDRQEVSSLIQTSNGGYALVGRTASLEDDKSDFWMLITDEKGIPEFPSWIILPFLIVATLVSVIIRNKIRKKEIK